MTRNPSGRAARPICIRRVANGNSVIDIGHRLKCSRERSSEAIRGVYIFYYIYVKEFLIFLFFFRAEEKIT